MWQCNPGNNASQIRRGAFGQNFLGVVGVDGGMGRKRDLKNVHAKRPPSFNPEDPDDLNEWGEELARMTDRRRQHNERHKPGKAT